MIEIIIAISYALQISGTALLASKIIGFNKNKIMDRATGTSIMIFLNKKEEPFILKETYCSILNENIMATLGLVWVLVGIIISILKLNVEFAKLNVIVLLVILSIFVYFFTKFISFFIIKIMSKNWNKYIKINNVPNGSSSIMMDDEEIKE